MNCVRGIVSLCRSGRRGFGRTLLKSAASTRTFGTLLVLPKNSRKSSIIITSANPLRSALFFRQYSAAKDSNGSTDTPLSPRIVAKMRWQTKPALIVFSTAVALCGVLAAISDPNLARLGLWSTPYSLLVAGLGFRFIASTSPWKDPRTQAGWATALILFTNGSVLGAVGAGGLTLAMFFPNIDLVAISLTLLMSCIYAGVGSLVSTIGVPVGYLVGRSLLADCVEDDGSKNHPL